MTIQTITKIPPTPEQILCMMNDLYMESKADNDRASQLKLLPMMSRVSIYLHVRKHKHNHYMTSTEALKTLSTQECMKLMSSLFELVGERGGNVGMLEPTEPPEDPQPQYPVHQPQWGR